MPLQGHNMLGFIFMLAMHIGYGKLNLTNHNEVGALCWLSIRRRHPRASELREHRPGYPTLLGCSASGQHGHTDSRPLLGMGEVKDMKQWVPHPL